MPCFSPRLERSRALADHKRWMAITRTVFFFLLPRHEAPNLNAVDIPWFSEYLQIIELKHVSKRLNASSNTRNVDLAAWTQENLLDPQHLRAPFVSDLRVYVGVYSRTSEKFNLISESLASAIRLIIVVYECLYICSECVIYESSCAIVVFFGGCALCPYMGFYHYDHCKQKNAQKSQRKALRI